MQRACFFIDLPRVVDELQIFRSGLCEEFFPHAVHVPAEAVVSCIPQGLKRIDPE